MRFLRLGGSDTGDSNAGPAKARVDTAASEPALEVTSAPPARTPRKGCPTPKRSEAQARRRGPVAPPPRTQREAYRRSKEVRGEERLGKEERRAAAAKRRAGMLAGDERYLMPRDRGPARAYARDLVDGRRNLTGLFMPLAVLVFVSVLVRVPAVQTYASLVTLCLLAAMIVEGLMLGRYVTARVRGRFPKEDVTARSFGWYAFTRATQLRRLRVPKPRVRPGGAPV